MAVYISLTVLVLATAMLIKKNNDQRDGQLLIHRGMTRQDMVNIVAVLIIFTLLFLVSALRLNVGNDYAKYVEFMHLVFSRAYVPTEAGFNALTYAVYYLCGYENYILVFAIFAFATVYFFMKALWEQSVSFIMSFGMYMLLGYYFQSISTVRYYLALGMALYSVKYLLKKDWPRFLLLILVGALFHKSLLVVLLLYPIARYNLKRWMYGVFVLLGASCLFLQDLYLKVVIFLYPSYKDTEYLEGGTSYVNIARCLLILILALVLYKNVIKDSAACRFYFNCNFLALVLYVFGSFLPIISRIGYYLTVTHILFVPALILGVKDDKKRRILEICAILACVLYFALYMRGASADGVRILPYQTFLFHDMPMTLSERGY
ncbi:MAG: EpsG family protein [Butyrivibrio sp.]|nr:EpsG family protein [Butyrivibrio sp.]